MIRNYRPADLDVLRRMHAAQQIDYPFPDLDDDQFLVKKVATQADAPTMSLVVRITSEAYMLFDPKDGTPPRERLATFLDLHESARQAAVGGGLADIHCWLPPSVEKSFGKRLRKLGWDKALWPCYVLELEEKKAEVSVG